VVAFAIFVIFTWSGNRWIDKPTASAGPWWICGKIRFAILLIAGFMGKQGCGFAVLKINPDSASRPQKRIAAPRAGFASIRWEAVSPFRRVGLSINREKHGTIVVSSVSRKALFAALANRGEHVPENRKGFP